MLQAGRSKELSVFSGCLTSNAPKFLRLETNLSKSRHRSPKLLTVIFRRSNRQLIGSNLFGKVQKVRQLLLGEIINRSLLLMFASHIAVSWQ